MIGRCNRRQTRKREFPLPYPALGWGCPKPPAKRKPRIASSFATTSSDFIARTPCNFNYLWTYYPRHSQCDSFWHRSIKLRNRKESGLCRTEHRHPRAADTSNFSFDAGRFQCCCLGVLGPRISRLKGKWEAAHFLCPDSRRRLLHTGDLSAWSLHEDARALPARARAGDRVKQTPARACPCRAYPWRRNSRPKR